jgi:hypothetical protein
MARRTWVLATVASLSLVLASDIALGQVVNARGRVMLQEFVVPDQTMNAIRREWFERLLATYPKGSWAPLKFYPTDSQLARMGLPSKKILLRQRYPVPTMIDRAGRTTQVRLPRVSAPQGSLGPTVTSYAGAGWFGIRPGAWLLLLNGGEVGWCSMAHVYGSPGSYKISTAGHCGKTGDTATVIAAFGNRAGVLNPILLDFGKFGTSRDGGLGNDWALIDIDPRWQYLVTPTMAFWGGPRGMYTKTGGVATVSFPRRGLPRVSVTPDPFLAQAVVHYGHGIGVGAGGTPRAGTSIHWGATHYMFIGAITQGDSGAGSNTLTGDTVGANMEAAGIMTHLYIDPLMRKGIGIMGGTRASVVRGVLANGQIVPYPVPATGLP